MSTGVNCLLHKDVPYKSVYQNLSTHPRTNINSHALYAKDLKETVRQQTL